MTGGEIFGAILTVLIIGGIIGFIYFVCKFKKEDDTAEVTENTSQEAIEKRCTELGCLSYQSFIMKTTNISRRECLFIPSLFTDVSDPEESWFIYQSFSLISRSKHELTQSQIKAILLAHKGYFNKLFKYDPTVYAVNPFQKKFVDYFTGLGFMYNTSKIFEEERDIHGILIRNKTTIHFCAWTSKAVEYLAELEKNCID